MASHSLWFSVLITTVIQPHLAVRRPGASTPPKRTDPWRFMTSRFIYLNSTTVETHDVGCTKAKTSIVNWKNKTFSIKQVEFMTTGKTSVENMVFRAVRKGVWETPRYSTRGDLTKYIFNYTIENCAVIKKQKLNNMGQVYREAWELWVNNKFGRKPEDEAICKQRYNSLCNGTKPTEYNIEYCEERWIKQYLLH
uniref:Putative group iv salivary lipocalin n=1 Tax=Rhipicephalus pulchellus TaxID=72859 RepID=L7MBV7_RHIPC